jgi:hypothetical protein
MQNVLTHKILDDKQCSSTRLNMLRIASSLLETESDSANRLGCPTMSPVTLCSLAKGIAACVLHALSTEREVNEAFVSASFACARTLIVIPASCIKNTAVGCLIDWICEVRDKASEEMSPEVVHARYLYCFCKWLVGVGNLIVENQVERINAFRSELLSKKHHPGTDWPSVSLLSDDKAISDQMRDLEARVFPVARLANGKAITNVYAASVRTKRAVEATTSISSSNDDGLVEWHPSTALISVVLDFKTKAAYGYVQ